MSNNTSNGLAISGKAEQSLPAPAREQAAELARLTTDQLKSELARSLEMTASHLMRLALIVRTLEDRGEDLAGLKIHMLPYLRQIAYGQVLPEIVVRFAESPLLIRSISTLPIPDQRRIADGEPVAMAVRRDDGTTDHRLVDPVYLRREQIAQVFARDHIRPLEEQAVILDGRRAPRDRRKPDRAEGERIRPDRERGGVVVGRTFIPTADVLAALAALGRDQADEDESEADDGTRKQVGVHLTEAQYDRLRKAAFDGRTKPATLTRRAMAACGLI